MTHICPSCRRTWKCHLQTCKLSAITICYSCGGPRSIPNDFTKDFTRDFTFDDLSRQKDEEMEKTLFYIKVKSNFVPTMTAVKQKLGVGNEVISVEAVKDFPDGIVSSETAFAAIINVGYKELIRRYHPDLVKADPDVIKHLTGAKKQLDELLKRIA